MRASIATASALTRAPCTAHIASTSYGPCIVSRTPTRHLSACSRRGSSVMARSLEERFKNSYTMSQVYVTEKDRPAPIPLSEHEARRKKREVEEIAGAAKRKGIPADVVAARLAELDALLPGLVNLHKAKASDWVTISSDVPGVMAKLISLKDVFPNTNMLKVLCNQPRLLLRSKDDLVSDAKKVRQVLASTPDPDAIVEAVPDLIDPMNLTRAIGQIKSAYKGQDPLAVLARNPGVLRELGGEGDMEDSAEYGELSTKD